MTVSLERKMDEVMQVTAESVQQQALRQLTRDTSFHEVDGDGLCTDVVAAAKPIAADSPAANLPNSPPVGGGSAAVWTDKDAVAVLCKSRVE